MQPLDAMAARAKEAVMAKTMKARNLVQADAGRYGAARAGAARAWKQLEALMAAGASPAEVAEQAALTARAVNLVRTEASWLVESRRELAKVTARPPRR